LHPGRARFDATKLRAVRTVRAYDELVIAPMHGFPNAHDYYVRTSSGPLLGQIEVPTLLVHAADDPMVTEPSVRPSLRQASRAIRIAWSERGGHVGWFGGVSESAWLDTWAMQRVIAFFRAP
jgi:predicted alpha/beta-fold hydrolase